MSERILTQKITARLKAFQKSGVPLFWFKVHGGVMQKAGIPDLCVVVAGRAVFMEIKQPGKNLSRLQKHRIGEIRKAGGRAEKVSSVEEVEAIVAQELGT